MKCKLKLLLLMLACSVQQLVARHTVSWIVLAQLLLCFSCQEFSRKDPRPFPTVELEGMQVVQVDEKVAETIKIKDTERKVIPNTELIEDFYYVPLETTDESLFAYCNYMEFFDGKIYVFDRYGTRKLFMFDDKGHYLKSLGEKGGAPFEFFLPASFTIDEARRQLVIYDNQKRKWMHFSLNGEYIYSKDVPFRTSCNFLILPNGEYVTATHKGSRNIHLGGYSDYRLLYTDSLGQLQKAALTYPETEFSSLAYMAMRKLGNEFLYMPMYLNEVYSVTDTALHLRYKIDYSDFAPFEKERLGTFDSDKAFSAYENAHTYIWRYAENDTHVMFVMCDRRDRYFLSIYDKRSKKVLNVNGFYNDNEFSIEFNNNIYSYKDYFVALVSPAILKGVKRHLDQHPEFSVDAKNMEMIENLKEDDNLVVVFFKIKDL